jgi:predicted dehydrogenase
MLAKDVVDAVSVCTPNNTHMAIALDAIKAGKDVLCEKPIAMSAQQARRMVGAAKAGRRILMTAQSARYSSAAQYVKRLVDAGRFGEVYFGKAVWFRRDGIPRGWFQDRKQSGGGPLIDLGVHAIDLLWWLMGRPKPVSAYGVTFDHLGTTGQGMGGWGVGYNPAKFSVEDMVGAIIRFQDGRAISVDISWAAHTSETYWLRIFGTKGGAQVQPEVVLYQNDDSVKLDIAANAGRQNAYAAEIQHFADCVRRREEPMSPGSHAVVVMGMLDAIAVAARTGRMAPIRTA